MDEKDLEEMILSGAVEIAAIDQETGEFLYNFTEKLPELYPEIANKVSDAFYQEILALWEAGFINLDVTSPMPLVTLSDRALVDSEIQKLPPQLRITLRNIVAALRINEDM